MAGGSVLMRMAVRMRMHDPRGVPVKMLMDQVDPAEEFGVPNDLPRIAGSGQPAPFQQDTAVGNIKGQIQVVGRDHDGAFPVAE